MAYRLKPGKLSAKALNKVAREQIARALTALAKDGVTATDVHEARKVVKRLRSLLRLVQPALEPKDFAKRYKSIGQAGDMLAGARDRFVMGQTIGQLEGRFGAEAVSAFASVRQALDASSVAPGCHIDPDAIAQARIVFEKEARAFGKLKLRAKGAAIIADGLERTYKTARANFARAYETPDDEHFHEFRKAVQWHWRHMALLSRAWPSYFAVRIAACQELADALGDDHDLSVLLAEAKRVAGNSTSSEDAERLIRLAQRDLRHEAYALAERLLAEHPKAFRRRMEAYWCAVRPLPPNGGAGGDDLVS